MKLHLGCGKKYIQGFVHIDVVPFPHIDHVTNIDNLSMIGDNSIDLIYNCHVLEHFKRQDVPRILKEWYRVLKFGGILRTSVPDFEKLTEVYQKNKNLNTIIGPLYGKLDYLYNIHYNVFDYTTLKNICSKQVSQIYITMIGVKRNMQMLMIIVKHTYHIWIKTMVF